MKTALVLGGGGARGAYEVGVWQALRELGIEIDIVTGTSVGALNGAVIVQGIFDEAVDLWKNLEADNIPDVKLDDILKRHVDEELIRKSPVDFGIVTVEIPKITPKHLFKEDIPRGQMVDFLQASSAFFPAVKSIDNVKYIDGGYYDNLPVNMALEKGAEYIITVDLDSIGITRRPPVKNTAEFHDVHCSWPLGSVTVFDKNNALKLMRLGYLDTMKSFGVFDGTFYTFIKGCLDRRLLNGAESAGQIFELDPTLIYAKESFQKRLQAAFDSHSHTMDKEIAAALDQFRRRRLAGGIARLLKQLNNKTLTVVLFQLISDGTLALQKNIKSQGGTAFDSPKIKTPFGRKAACRLFPTEMAAASYLLRITGAKT